MKHPLALDDRKELLYQLLMLAAPDVKFPRVGLYNWGPRTVHAALMICSRVEPSTTIRSLRNDQGVYETDHAARVLLEACVSLYPEQAERDKVVLRLRDNCYERQDIIIAEAERLGFVPGELEDKVERGNNRCDSRNGTPLSALPGRELGRRTTDEELESLNKKTRDADDQAGTSEGRKGRHRRKQYRGTSPGSSVDCQRTSHRPECCEGAA